LKCTATRVRGVRWRAMCTEEGKPGRVCIRRVSVAAGIEPASLAGMKTIDVEALATVSGGKGKGVPMLGRPGWTEEAEGVGGDLKVRAISPSGKKGPWRFT